MLNDIDYDDIDYDDNDDGTVVGNRQRVPQSLNRQRVGMLRASRRYANLVIPDKVVVTADDNNPPQWTELQLQWVDFEGPARNLVLGMDLDSITTDRGEEESGDPICRSLDEVVYLLYAAIYEESVYREWIAPHRCSADHHGMTTDWVAAVRAPLSLFGPTRGYTPPMRWATVGVTRPLPIGAEPTTPALRRVDFTKPLAGLPDETFLPSLTSHSPNLTYDMFPCAVFAYLISIRMSVICGSYWKPNSLVAVDAAVSGTTGFAIRTAIMEAFAPPGRLATLWLNLMRRAIAATLAVTPPRLFSVWHLSDERFKCPLPRHRASNPVALVVSGAKGARWVVCYPVSG